jgi:putative holliday junction resolvase
MRVLGIDFGERRVGLSVSDPTGTIATPLPTLERRAGKRPPVEALARVATEWEVEAVVMGLPLDLRGMETEWSLQVRAVGEKLGARLDVPVHYVDERMTSVRAERAVRSMGLPKHRREERARVDQAAAILILQAWLDRRNRPDEPADTGKPTTDDS